MSAFLPKQPFILIFRRREKDVICFTVFFIKRYKGKTATESFNHFIQALQIRFRIFLIVAIYFTFDNLVTHFLYLSFRMVMPCDWNRTCTEYILVTWHLHYMYLTNYKINILFISLNESVWYNYLIQ